MNINSHVNSLLSRRAKARFVTSSYKPGIWGKISFIFGVLILSVYKYVVIEYEYAPSVFCTSVSYVLCCFPAFPMPANQHISKRFL